MPTILWIDAWVRRNSFPAPKPNRLGLAECLNFKLLEWEWVVLELELQRVAACTIKTTSKWNRQDPPNFTRPSSLKHCNRPKTLRQLQEETPMWWWVGACLWHEIRRKRPRCASRHPKANMAHKPTTITTTILCISQATRQVRQYCQAPPKVATPTNKCRCQLRTDQPAVSTNHLLPTTSTIVCSRVRKEEQEWRRG